MKIEGKPFSAFDAAKLPGGLVPAVIQDDRTLQVLMLGYMNREAYEKSLAEGRVTFYSRSRQRLWTKGETSGNWLDIVSVAADCDCDTLLIRVIPHGRPATRGRKPASERPCPKPKVSSATCKASSGDVTPRCPKAPTPRSSSTAA